MRKIKEYVEWLDDEICGAKLYAEKYIELKADGDTQTAGKFKNIAQTELEHATFIHGFIVKEINKIRTVYVAPQEMLDKWDHEHKSYVERVAWVKQMLEM